jgi:hypothetical protein
MAVEGIVECVNHCQCCAVFALHDRLLFKLGITGLHGLLAWLNSAQLCIHSNCINLRLPAAKYSSVFIRFICG